MGVFQSGQMGQTVNLLAYAFGGSNPSTPTLPTSPLGGVVLFLGDADAAVVVQFQTGPINPCRLAAAG
jgi:hypothetical protein